MELELFNQTGCKAGSAFASFRILSAVLGKSALVAAVFQVPIRFLFFLSA
jgi:hypothetical protein